jgi:hypothetical protein
LQLLPYLCPTGLRRFGSNDGGGKAGRKPWYLSALERSADGLTPSSTALPRKTGEELCQDLEVKKAYPDFIPPHSGPPFCGSRRLSRRPYVGSTGAASNPSPLTCNLNVQLAHWTKCQNRVRSCGRMPDRHSCPICPFSPENVAWFPAGSLSCAHSKRSGDTAVGIPRASQDLPSPPGTVFVNMSSCAPTDKAFQTIEAHALNDALYGCKRTLLRPTAAYTQPLRGSTPEHARPRRVRCDRSRLFSRG